MGFLDYGVQGNPLRTWLLALAVTLALGTALSALRRSLVRRLEARAATTSTTLDDLAATLLRGLGRWTVAVVAIYVGSLGLALRPNLHALLRAVLVVVVAVQVGLWGQAVIRHVVTTRVERDDADGGTKTTAAFAAFAARIVLWALLLLLLLDNLGVNISSLLAGLGVGGIAVALAVQNVLGDVLASLSIALDRPFVVGDFIVVDSLAGTVEHIGLKTTRVRALTGEMLVLSNGDLLRSRLHNFKHLVERRIVLGFGVLYQTTADQLEAIPAMVREAVEATGKARFDRSHLKSFGASSLDFETVYYVLDPDYAVHMNVQQQVMLTLIRRFEASGIGFAYPTQTLYVQQLPAPTPVEARPAVPAANGAAADSPS